MTTEVNQRIKEKYLLTHLNYSAYTARDLGFPEFTYGFRYQPDVLYAAWQPEVTYEPRAIKVAEDVVIPWKNSIDGVEVFGDTVEVANLKFR